MLRLEQNIFRARAVRAEEVPVITDGMVVTAIAVDGEAVDLDYRPPRRGRDGRAGRGGETAGPEQTFVNGLETTSGSIQLKDPIPAGSSVTLDVEWHFTVPASAGGRGLRMGAWGDSLFQLAQWYPYVAAYDDLRGWDTDPYLGPSEFYHNFGRFDVHIDVPVATPSSSTRSCGCPTRTPGSPWWTGRTRAWSTPCW